MASKTSIRQQCPHCDATIPIKDESMIGEEINCPKCKKPFVVEDPDDVSPAPVKKSKSGNTKETSGKNRLRGDDDDDEAKQTKKAKGGLLSSPKVLMGLGLAVVAVVLLAFAGYVMMGGEEKKTPTSSPAASGGNTAGAQNTGGSASEIKETPKPIEKTIMVGNATNLLPNDTEIVFDIFMQEMLHNRLGRILFDSAGQSRASSFDGQIGFPMDDVERWIVAASQSKDWAFVVFRTKSPVKTESIIKAMKLKPAEEGPIQGQEYYVTTFNWLAAGSPLEEDPIFANSKASMSRHLAVRVVDPQTVVIGDLAPIREFLKVKGQPPTRAQSVGDGAAAPPAGAPARRGGIAGAGTAPNTPDAGVIASNNFMTIKPSMKLMLDRVESKTPILFSTAVDVDQVKRAQTGIPSNLNISPNIFGIALQWQEKINFQSGIECKSDDEAKKLRTEMDTGLRFLAGLVSGMGVKVEFTAGPAGPGIGAGAGGGPAGTPGGMRPGIRSVNPPRGGGGPPTNPGGSGNIGSTATAKVSLTQQGRNVLLAIEMTLDEKVYDAIVKGVEPYLIRIQSEFEMAIAHPHPRQLGDAGQHYSQENRQFPLGTINRKPIAARAKRPFPPDEKVSWMADLLPYLGYEGLFRRIKTQQSWKDPENLVPSVTLIPAFLDGHAPRSQWYIRYPKMTYDVAATNYVGIAGVGMDAANYKASDPSVAKKLGIFGYDRVTRLEDIADGLANTIFMIKVPPTFKSPWLAGGGSTIRGVPESHSIEPFVSTERDGKRGTMAVMADGSVRYISENIADDVFKSLCTIHGGEPKLNLDQIAPLVPAPEDDQAESKAIQVAEQPKFAKPPEKLEKETTPEGWRLYYNPLGRFEVMLPGVPKETITSVTNNLGLLQVHTLDLTINPDVSYSISYTDYPIIIKSGDREKKLAEARDAYLRSVKGSLVSERSISLDEFPGVEFEVKIPGKGVVRSRMYLVHLRFYQLISGVLDKMDSSDPPRFLTSFRLRPS